MKYYLLNLLWTCLKVELSIIVRYVIYFSVERTENITKKIISKQIRLSDYLLNERR